MTYNLDELEKKLSNINNELNKIDILGLNDKIDNELNEIDMFAKNTNNENYLCKDNILELYLLFVISAYTSYINYYSLKEYDVD